MEPHCFSAGCLISIPVFVFPVGTGYFQDCQYFHGPAYPPKAYLGPLAYPCVTSIDDDTGVIISGKYYNYSISDWITIPSVWSYNFTSANWKNLANAPFLLNKVNCIRVKLATGKNAILVTGKLHVNNVFLIGFLLTLKGCKIPQIY